MKKVLAIGLFVMTTTGIVSAAYHVPEIDAGSAGTAIALISSALLMVRRKKA